MNDGSLRCLSERQIRRWWGWSIYEIGQLHALSGIAPQHAPSIITGPTRIPKTPHSLHYGLSSALFPTPTPVFSRLSSNWHLLFSRICTLLVDDHCERLRIQTKQILSQQQSRQHPLLVQCSNSGSAEAARPGGPASSYSAALRRGYEETITDQCNYSSQTHSDDGMIGIFREANSHVDKVLRNPHIRFITCFFIAPRKQTTTLSSSGSRS